MQLDFDDFTAVHASLSDDEPWQYVLSPVDALRHFMFQEKPLCFCGHSHRPALWTLEGKKVRCLAPASNLRLPPGARTLVNVGSVGQPRNLRPEACYVIYDRVALSIGFRFVPYNVKETQGKILAAGLPRFLVQRWRWDGRAISDWQLVGFAIRCTFEILMMASPFALPLAEALSLLSRIRSEGKIGCWFFFRSIFSWSVMVTKIRYLNFVRRQSAVLGVVSS